MELFVVLGKHSSTSSTNCTTPTTSTTSTANSVKRGSSSHRRDKTKDKQHGSSTSGDKCHKVNSSLSSELNGRSPVSQSAPRASTFPALSSNTQSPNVPGPGPSVEAGTSTVSNVANGSEQNVSPPIVPSENIQTPTKSSTSLSTLAKPLQSTSPPPTNKVKTANSSTSASFMEQKVYIINFLFSIFALKTYLYYTLPTTLLNFKYLQIKNKKCNCNLNIYIYANYFLIFGIILFYKS